MVPGMQHCGGGPGATSFGLGDAARTDAGHEVASLVQWVENGQAPDRPIATKYRDGDETKGVEMTRPLCAYPKFAKYSGSGDPNAAAWFACKSEN